MTEEDALYRAILQNALDDTPRLVYADWLDEQGDIRVDCPICTGVLRQYEESGPFMCGLCNDEKTILNKDRSLQAECIRLDIERERRWPKCWKLTEEKQREFPDYEEFNAIQFRLMTLYRTDHKMMMDSNATWFKPHPDGLPQGSLLTCRGFIGRLQMPSWVFIVHAEELFRNHPIELVELPGTIRGGAAIFRGAGDGNIPEEIFKYLQKGSLTRNGRYSGTMRNYYEDPELLEAHRQFGSEAALYSKAVIGTAEDDLSQACVRWAREKAGLPALPALPELVGSA